MINKEAAAVDILIITYNQEDYIEEAIESAINQDYSNKKIILADDASTDRTPEIIKKYSKEYPDLIIPAISKNNGGISTDVAAVLTSICDILGVSKSEDTSKKEDE